MVDAYGSAGDRQFEEITTEVWIDLESGQYHRRYIGTARGDDGKIVNNDESVFDGEFVLSIYHSDRYALYWHQSPLMREREGRRLKDQFFNQTGLSSPKFLNTFEKAREEVIGGELCDVWPGSYQRRRAAAVTG